MVDGRVLGWPRYFKKSVALRHIDLHCQRPNFKQGHRSTTGSGVVGARVHVYRRPGAASADAFECICLHTGLAKSYFKGRQWGAAAEHASAAPPAAVKPLCPLTPNCGHWIVRILWRRDGGVTAMRRFDWVRAHKVRSGLIVIALFNVIYLLWCSMADTPASSFSKLLTPLVILSGVILGRPESRKSS